MSFGAACKHDTRLACLVCGAKCSEDLVSTSGFVVHALPYTDNLQSNGTCPQHSPMPREPMPLIAS